MPPRACMSCNGAGTKVVYNPRTRQTEYLTCSGCGGTGVSGYDPD